jgi:hypothetical protein
MAPSPLGGRSGFAHVWTGHELIVWGGGAFPDHQQFGDGARYDPKTNQWRSLAASPLAPRYAPTAAWTGQQVLVWGGIGPEHNGMYRDGAVYDPASDHWTRIPDGVLTAREGASGTWTGREVLVLGGLDQSGHALRDGAAYNPVTQTWRKLADAPLIPSTTSAAWTGTTLIVGARGSPSAAAYDPVRDIWQSLPTAPYAPFNTGNGSLSSGVTGVWAGRDYIVLQEADSHWPSVAYTPGESAWRTLAAPPITIQAHRLPIWAGDEAVILGSDHSLAYNPTRNTWRILAPLTISRRVDGAELWTGHEVIVWGGLSSTPPQHTLNDGVRYIVTNDETARQPTKGPVPPFPGGGITSEQMAQVPDYVPTVDSGTKVLGYVSKCDLGYCPDRPVRPGQVETVYGEDLQTVVGHMYPNKGFVPLGTNPADAPSDSPTTYTSPPRSP